MDQNNKRKRMKREEVDSSMIIVDDGNVPQSCEALAQVQRPATPTTSIGRLKRSGVSEAQPYHGGDGDGAADDDGMEFRTFYSSGQLIELCTQYNVLGEDQQTNKDMLRKLVVNSTAAKGGRIFPAELPHDLQVLVLLCANQNGFEESELSKEAVPRENAQFPESLLRFPQQVEYLETPLARTRDFFCNYRFCHHSEDRRVCLKDIVYGHCSGCDNLLHKGCGNYDTSNPDLRVCGWCSDSLDENERQDRWREMEAQEDEERQQHGENEQRDWLRAMEAQEHEEHQQHGENAQQDRLRAMEAQEDEERRQHGENEQHGEGEQQDRLRVMEAQEQEERPRHGEKEQQDRLGEMEAQEHEEHQQHGENEQAEGMQHAVGQIAKVLTMNTTEAHAVDQIAKEDVIMNTTEAQQPKESNQEKKKKKAKKRNSVLNETFMFEDPDDDGKSSDWSPQEETRGKKQRKEEVISTSPAGASSSSKENNVQVPSSSSKENNVQVPTMNSPHAPSESLESLKVSELKEKLRQYGLKLSGKKAELQARLEEYMSLHYHHQEPPTIISGSIDEYEQQDQLMREMEGQYYDERQQHGVQRVFKFDTIPLDQFQGSLLNRSRVQCYICNEELWLPKHIVFPFHRAYSGFGDKSKDRPDTARKRKEFSARRTLFTHNAELHKVGFGEEQIEVPIFESFIKAKLPLNARTYAASFAEVRLEASQLTDDPFNDCTLYFTRWGTYIETDGKKLAARELRTEKDREKEGREMSVRKAKGKRRKTTVKTLLDTVSGVVTKVVDTVKQLLLEERRKPDANFVNQVFQERLRQCIANSSTKLGCKREAFMIACMIQRRMLALPLLYKEVKESDADEVPNDQED